MTFFQVMKHHLIEDSDRYLQHGSVGDQSWYVADTQIPLNYQPYCMMTEIKCQDGC